MFAKPHAPGAVSASMAGRSEMIRSAACSALAALVIAAFGFVAHAPAQTYPTKPITIVVPLAAGTRVDSVARLYGGQLPEGLGKPGVIEDPPAAAPAPPPGAGPPRAPARPP